MLNKFLFSIVIFILTASLKAEEAQDNLEESVEDVVTETKNTGDTLKISNPIELTSNHPQDYVVVKGDTLWDISGRFLTEPWRWQEIWDFNPQIENPHLIYPGDIISLSYRDGKPVLGLKRDGSSVQTDGHGGQIVSGRNIKLSPSIRSLNNVRPIPTIPIDAIQQFLKRFLVLENDKIDEWPYVVSNYEENLISSQGDLIYARGIDETSPVKKYSIYRKGDVYHDPEKEFSDENASNKDKILGYEAIYVGDAELEKSGDPSSLVVKKSKREILVGDRLLPISDELINADFIIQPLKGEQEGKIISIIDGFFIAGQYQVVVLSLGNEQGIVPGNVLGIYQHDYVVEDTVGVDFKGKSKKVTLPESHIGVVMVFRTFKKVSYALVLESKNAISILDIAKKIL